MPGPRLSIGRSVPREPSRSRGTTERRYHNWRWRLLAEKVVRRDGHRCRIVPGCDVRATAADHVDPVYPGMPDSEFYDITRLRAACVPHNLWRGLEQRAKEREESRSFRSTRTARLLAATYDWDDATVSRLRRLHERFIGEVAG